MRARTAALARREDVVARKNARIFDTAKQVFFVHFGD